MKCHTVEIAKKQENDDPRSISKWAYTLSQDMISKSIKAEVLE